MEQHPMPRQITTFEFKLIGFMTLHQFLYLVISFPLGFIVFKLFPIPILNILLGVIVASFGIALAFVPINDRPMDVWIKNFIKRLNSPTQYLFHKQNPALSIFQNLYFVSDPHRVMAHIESQQKLSAYLNQTKQTMQANQSRQQVQSAFVQPQFAVQPTPAATQDVVAQPFVPAPDTQPAQPVISNQEKKPFFIGTVKNNKKIPLPGILIYVKDRKGSPVRLLKTNPHGIFATYGHMSEGDYTFDIKDPKGTYFFDTITVQVAQTNPKPFEFYSKELL